MNPFIKNQITNMTVMANAFLQGCQFAATQDDGKVSKEEAKTLKKIELATKRYIKELNSLK